VILLTSVIGCNPYKEHRYRFEKINFYSVDFFEHISLINTSINDPLYKLRLDELKIEGFILRLKNDGEIVEFHYNIFTKKENDYFQYIITFYPKIREIKIIQIPLHDRYLQYDRLVSSDCFFSNLTKLQAIMPLDQCTGSDFHTLISTGQKVNFKKITENKYVINNNGSIEYIEPGVEIKAYYIKTCGQFFLFNNNKQD
jgi:hypothetical protein